MKRVLVPMLALVAAAVIGGVSAVGIWEALEEDASTGAPTVAAPATQPVSGEPAAAGATSIRDLYRRVSPGVVQIRVAATGSPDSPFGDQFGASGSGFVIDEQGRIVTNYHVVEDAETVTVVFDDGDEERARVLGSDPSSDIALLELENADRELTALELGSAEALQIGDPVIAIGSPFGLQGTVTSGIVSALHRELQAPVGEFAIDGAIQTDAALNRGNSGGPLLDGNGLVVGVNSQIASTTGANAGIGYAVPAETVKRVVEQLLTDGEVRYAYLGVRMEEADEGIRIVEVVDGGPAAAAGLEEGDIVLRADGEELADAVALRQAVTARRPGEQLELDIRRGTESRTIVVELGTRPESVQ